MALANARFLKLLTKIRRKPLSIVTGPRISEILYKKTLTFCLAVLSFFRGREHLKAAFVSERGGKLRDQHKIIDDLDNERKKQAILSLILSVILIVFGIAVVVAVFH
jgi:hypothetical protein